MPELPDIELYLTALNQFILGKPIESITVKSPFVVRTFEPDLSECVGLQISGLNRLGKRVVWQLDNGWYIVFHLMIAGRYHWKVKPTLPRGKNDLVAFGFERQTLMLTEASPKKRASIHVVTDVESMEAFRPTGLEIDSMTRTQFAEQISRKNHTLKRSLTDPRLFSGIGNAYSDEILHAAKLSPVKWTSRLTGEETSRLYDAIRAIMELWTARLVEQNQNRFPEKVTAFRPEMSVHGKFGQPCPVCQTEVQRIRYADRETNYCPRCQTEGKLLADRSLSRLLKDDWPQSIEELEDN